MEKFPIAGKKFAKHQKSWYNLQFLFANFLFANIKQDLRHFQ